MNTEFLTKPANSAFHRVLSNRHTSIAGLVYCLALGLPHLIIQLTHVWAPEYVPQTKTTCEAIAEWVKGAAVAYGLLMAGDSSPETKTR